MRSKNERPAVMRGCDDTIAALATGRGGAIAVIRMSGLDAVDIAGKIFVARNGFALSKAAGYTVHFGEIREPAVSGGGAHPCVSYGAVVDEVIVTVFRAPHSYTGEDSVEISCHASPYIEGRIMQLLLDAGARTATAGEFTVRAFLAGRLDLAQAEAVADLIASSGRAQHSLAIGQIKGGVSSALGVLRGELVTLAALLELELDFSEEDVEFASRERLGELARGIAAEIDGLAGSFSLGNAIREGVPVAIVGRPNVGKSTLLNALVGDDRAMVSEIAGTTRDRIEERVNIDGVGFRFIDTAGLRATDDALERMGIDRTLDAVRKARIVLLIVEPDADDISQQVAGLDLSPDQKLYVVQNKADRQQPVAAGYDSLHVSAKTGAGLNELRGRLAGTVDTEALDAGVVVVSNARHYEALVRSRDAVGRILAGLATDSPVEVSAAGDTGDPMSGSICPAAGVSTDLFAEDIREVLHHLGTITGEVTTDEILGAIFSRFCIGK